MLKTLAKLVIRHWRELGSIPASDVDHYMRVWNTMRSGFRHGSEIRGLPWYTYPAIEYLDSIDWSAASVFEYGAGNSTLWWSERAQRVVSVESEIAWCEQLRPKLPKNCTLLGVSDREAYIETPRRERLGPYDLIVVDGIGASMARYECCQVAVQCLASSGAILLDNSDWLPQSCDLLSRKGFLRIDYNGFVPQNLHAGRTSLFVHPTWHPKFKPHTTVGGFVADWESETEAEAVGH